MAALLALLAAAAWGTSDYAAGSASRRSSAVSVVVLTHFAAVAALLVVALDADPIWAMLGDIWSALRFDEPLAPVDTTRPIRWAAPAIGGDPTATDVAWGLAAGLGGGLGAMLLFRGLGRGSMALVAPITATGAAAVPALYGIAGGETMTTAGIAGIALALVAIVLVSVSAGGPDEIGPDAPDETGPDALDEIGTDALPAPTVDAGLARPLPPPRSGVPLGVAAGPLPSGSGARQPVGAGALPPPSAPDRAGEIRMSLRRMRATIVGLLLATLFAAAIAAAGPVGTVVAGGSLTTVEIVTLAVAGVVVASAVLAVNAVKLLFTLQPARPPEIERRTDPPSFDGRARRIERRTDPSAFDLRRTLRQPGLPEALLSGVGFGAFFVFISRAGESAGYWPLVGARTVSVVMFAIAALITSTAVLPARGSRRWVVLAGVLDAAAAVFFVLSTRAGLLSVGAVLASLYPVVTVLLARFVGGERIRRQQLVGLALAIGAVSLLAV